MYRVYCDDDLIYDERIETFNIVNPKLNLEANKTGSFTFTIYPSHPYYSSIREMISAIKVYQNSDIIFCGRVRSCSSKWHNEKSVTCEGELAFLLDSIQRPYEFTGGVKEFLIKLVNAHNSQSDHKFLVGNVTVTDPNDYIVRSDTTYMNTWDSMQKKLVELLGGYIVIRWENGKSYIDYLSDFSDESSQTIEFGKNLLDFKRTIKCEDVATVLIPLGEKNEDTGERLTISDVNDGRDYIVDEEAVKLYGMISKVNIWDDVTLPENLLKKGKIYLKEISSAPVSVELTAADLSSVDNSIEAFRFGAYIKVVSEPHSFSQIMLVSKISIDLKNPASNKLQLGAVSYSFTGRNLLKNNAIKTESDVLHKKLIVIQTQLDEVAFDTYVTTPITTKDGKYLTTSDGKYLLYKKE